MSTFLKVQTLITYNQIYSDIPHNCPRRVLAPEGIYSSPRARIEYSLLYSNKRSIQLEVWVIHFSSVRSGIIEAMAH